MRMKTILNVVSFLLFVCSGLRPAPDERLPSFTQPRRQPVWQACLIDPLLSGLHVVRDSKELDRIGVGIKDGESGAPIAIAGLPHRSGIDQISRAFFHRKSKLL